MAWEEQRRLRSAGSDDTAKIEGLPVQAATEAPDAGRETAAPAAPAGRGARAERWGQRFGWMAAVAIAVIALVVAVLAFANSGTVTAARVGRGNGYFAPYGRPGGAFGGPYGPGAGEGLGTPR
jgi:hypothetical protein